MSDSESTETGGEDAAPGTTDEDAADARTSTDGPQGMGEAVAPDETRVWMVERTYSADSPNILVIVYATPDGSQYVQKEWAFNRHGAGDAPRVTAAVDVATDRLDPVDGAETRDRYATEAQRMAEKHDPDDVV
ncbi:MAG: hypothetical protein ABEJ74_08430 [Haloferacaceae archaeon]